MHHDLHPMHRGRPIHPGEILREEYLDPLHLSAHALAKRLFVPASRINDIVLGRRGISADTALRLARYFGGDAQSWLNLQMIYDLRCAHADHKNLAKIALVQPHPGNGAVASHPNGACMSAG